MHLTRAETARRIPIKRKGSPYIARPLSHLHSSVNVLVAVRDMLGLARTAHEVKEMIKEKKLKINGRVVRDFHEPIILLSLFEADKRYILSVLTTGRFVLKETKQTTRFAKIVGKRLLRTGVVQFNSHDGTNFISKEKVNVGDSAEIDLHSKPISFVKLDKGTKVFVARGRAQGHEGTVSRVEGKKVSVKLHDRTVELSSAEVIAL